MKVKLLVQIGIVFGICLVGEGISRVLPFAFPASVISMILLFLLLLSGALKVEHIHEKGDFLLRNMAFFFIPSGVGLLITTVLTFAVSAVTIRLVSSWQNRLKKGGR